MRKASPPNIGLQRTSLRQGYGSAGASACGLAAGHPRRSFTRRREAGSLGRACIVTTLSLLFGLLATTPAVATSARPSNPIYHVDEVSVEVFIGGSGEMVPTPGAGLFDLAGAARFKVALEDRVSKRLRSAGIIARKGAGHALLLEFWGRQVPDPVCKPQYVVEVAASFHHPAKFDHGDVSWAHTIIEIAPADNLEGQIEGAVASLLDELLSAPKSSKWQ